MSCFWYAFSSLLAAEKYEPCRNPGAASTSMQSNEKAFYQAGETLSFSCQTGYELQGQATIYCIPGHPSQWNNTPPACKGTAHQHWQTWHSWQHADSRLWPLPRRSSKYCLSLQHQQRSLWMNASWMVSLPQCPTLQASVAHYCCKLTVSKLDSGVNDFMPLTL